MASGKMKIALIAPEIPDYAIEYAEVLSETCDVLLIIPDKFRTLGARGETRQLQIDWVNWPRQRNLKNVWFMLSVAKRIRRWGPDVVHCLDGNHIWMILLSWLVRPLPFVTTIHDIEVHPGDDATGRVPRGLVRILVGRSTAVVVHGEKLRQDFYKLFGSSQTAAFVFPIPPIRRYIRAAERRGYRKPDDKKLRILFFGRIHEYKGLRYLIESAPAVHEKLPFAKFIIAGRGDDFTQYRRLMADPSYFEVHNSFISDDEAARLFAEADILVLPYIEASQSAVLSIAMTFSLPVVATEVGEMALLVQQYAMGMIVPPRDSQALSNAIIQLATNTSLQLSYKQAMDDLTDEEFSVKALGSRAAELYTEVLQIHTSTCTRR